SKPVGRRIEGATKDAAIHGMAPVIEAIQAFACKTAQMSGQALDRTNRHIEKLRAVHSVEEAAAIQADFVKESLDHAVQHTRKFIQMRATFPPTLVQPVNSAADATEAARHAAAAKVERLSNHRN
ncbi:MAG: phasin family protein, partial [Methylocella sp.]